MLLLVTINNELSLTDVSQTILANCGELQSDPQSVAGYWCDR